MANSTQAILIIGHHFPEPNTTAAGTRMMQLIAVFQEANFTVTFASTASVSNHSADLKKAGIAVAAIQLNDASFDTFINALQPDLVLFDRYITEEQFGWRVTEQCPNALKILDTEDLHFLRKAREEAFKKTGDLKNTNLFTATTKRELASILRCDVTLIISSFEMDVLQTTFQLPASLLFYFPLLLTELMPLDQVPAFESRNGFMTIGNLHHAPNVDAVVYLKKEIWPTIKKQLPNATLSIYGMYAPQHLQQMHTEKEGFLMKGWAPEAVAAFQTAKMCLAPLRFGAGLKGKVVDALQYGTPIVTTSIGAEGIFTQNEIPASFAKHTQDFIEKALSLYTNETHWHQTQQLGAQCVSSKFDKKQFISSFISHIHKLQQHIDKHRQQHFLGQIIQHQSLQATKFMSKWIEEKNKKL